MMADRHRRDVKRQVDDEFRFGKVHEWFYRATQQCIKRF